jgi:hypothetical protein
MSTVVHNGAEQAQGTKALPVKRPLARKLKAAALKGRELAIVGADRSDALLQPVVRVLQ